MTPFEHDLWKEVMAASLVAQRESPRKSIVKSIKTADLSIIALRERMDKRNGRLHFNEQLEAERLISQQPYQPHWLVAGDTCMQWSDQPLEGAVSLATRLRDRILSVPEGGDAWNEHTMDEVMQLLDMVIGTPEDGQPTQSSTPLCTHQGREDNQNQ